MSRVSYGSSLITANVETLRQQLWFTTHYIPMTSRPVVKYCISSRLQYNTYSEKLSVHDSHFTSFNNTNYNITCYKVGNVELGNGEEISPTANYRIVQRRFILGLILSCSLSRLILHKSCIRPIGIGYTRFGSWRSCSDKSLLHLLQLHCVSKRDPDITDCNFGKD